MDIRCAKCEHVGPAASVAPTEQGVAFLCANCGHQNFLELPPTTPATPAAAALAPLGGGAVAARPPAQPADASGEAWLKSGMLERLIPQPGDGLRCRKCAYLLDAEQNCPRCGLNVIESRRFADGEAPWERPPDGLDGPYEQASLLWKSVEENTSDDNITKFAEFVREEGLLELGIRRLRFFLVDHPGHKLATHYLEQLAESFQAKMIVARAQAEVRAEDIVAATGRAKKVLLTVVFAMWLGIFVFLLGRLTGC